LDSEIARFFKSASPRTLTVETLKTLDASWRQFFAIFSDFGERFYFSTVGADLESIFNEMPVVGKPSLFFGARFLRQNTCLAQGITAI